MFEKSISFYASTQPDAPAIWTELAEVSYRRLHRDVNNLAAQLSTLLSRDRMVVFVEASPMAMHWLLLLALERLGHTTVSGVAPGLDPNIAAVSPDLVLSMKAPTEWSPGVRTIQINADWIIAALGASGEPPPRPKAQPEDLVRIILSSGTTGMPKQIPMTRAMLDSRLRDGVMKSDARTMCSMGPDTAGGYRLPLNTWWVGGAAVLVNQINARNLKKSRANVLVASPQQLYAILHESKEVLAGPEKVTVYVGGGLTPAALLEALKARPGAEMEVAYGSTEVGTVSIGPASVLHRHPNAAGFIAPMAEAEVLGPQGEVLGPGESGVLRVRTTGIAAEYLKHDAAKPSSLRDGWFYPGDLGFIAADGLLVIEGRVDEVMNIGGVKIAPNRVEDQAAAFPGVRDCAAFSLATAAGGGVLACAVVADETFDVEGVAAALLAAFRLPAKIVVVDQIARNGMGKIQRERVRQDAIAKLRLLAEGGRREAGPITG